MLWWSIIASACRSASKRAIDLLGIHPRLDDLQRDPPADGLLLLGHVDGAHAALADQLEELIRADAAPRAFGGRIRCVSIDALRRDGRGCVMDGQEVEGVARSGLAVRSHADLLPLVGPDERPVQEAVRLIVGDQERLDAIAKLGIGRAFPVEDRPAIVRVFVFKGGQENGLDAARVERHGGSPRIGFHLQCAVSRPGC